MASNEYRPIKQGEQNAHKNARTCLRLGLIKSSLESLSHWWRAEHEDPTASQPVEKKYMHRPTHAGSSFLRTTTTRGMQEANEIL
ncbi:2dbce6ed-c881-4e3b-a51e-03476da69990 [Thermothielavioides terrestris]|uniref:2dbce6ed-c881-4e3b-a51e-03476da69990 n=1 Tax=Thermothielavioides terrestris TaxID=2587410 RepID=A0A3S4ESL4_9PEZI|nr:2dbce6ed-c881-4e3b-a51e-03476da69990 [Thermothielavioides terrestris]